MVRAVKIFFPRLAVFLLIFFLQCSTGVKKTSPLYSSLDKDILARTTEAINYNYGYEEDLELDYFYFDSYRDLKRNNPKIKNFREAAKKFKLKNLISFYEKIYRLKLSTEIKMEQFKEDEEWKDYVYIKNYIYPPLEKYFSLLERTVLGRSRSYKRKIKKRKKIIKAEVEEEI